MEIRKRLVALSAVTTLGPACSDDPPAQPTTDTTTESDTDDTSPPGDPGSLVALSMRATVGVHIGDIPEPARARVAAELLARPDSFWQGRARRQIEFTSYRLVYRNYYYDPEEGKSIMPLPPVERWVIKLDGVPTLREIDGHAVVAVDYDFNSTLLGPADSAAKSDAMLADVGGIASESFVLPVDPEHVLERTGYACMNEADFPPNSVDTENARLFFDDTCEGGVMVDNDGCHLTYPIPNASCADAIAAHIGGVAAEVSFERLPWDATVADAARVGSQLPGVAELRAMPEGLDDNRIVYRYFAPDSCAIAEGCVGSAGWRRLLQFTATVQNLGAVDNALGDVSEGSAPVVNRLVSLSDCHGHMHFNHYGRFAFGAGDQQLGSKRAFCLESTWRYFNNEDTPFTHPYGCSYQGTAAGWGDDYVAGLDCQWVDVTPIDTTAAAHTSELSFHVNPDKFLCEGVVKTDENGEMLFELTDFTNEQGEPESRVACEEREGAEDNNRVARPLTLPAGNGGLVTEACARGQLGPVRNCGFTAPAAATECTPGERATVVCSGGNAERPAVVRLCEASGVLGAIPCTHLEALAVETILGEDVDVSFQCPVARDGALGENGGFVGLFVAPHVAGDAVDVKCELRK